MLRLCDLELHCILARRQLAHDETVDPVADGAIFGAGHALDTEFLRGSDADLDDFLFRIACLGHRSLAYRLKESWQANIPGALVSRSHTMSPPVIHARARPAWARCRRSRRWCLPAAERMGACIEELVGVEAREVERR